MYCARDLACAVLFSKNLHHSTVVFFDKKNPFLEVFFHTTVVIEVFYHTTVVFFFFAKRQIGTQRRAGDWPRLSIHVRGTFLKKKNLVLKGKLAILLAIGLLYHSTFVVLGLV
jgi:hypothetical protein